MSDQDINELLAQNLRSLMKRKGHTQTSLGAKSGVKQNTISLYLSPDKRKAGASGKPASGKLTEVAMMAGALGVNAYELILPGGATKPEITGSEWKAAAERVAKGVPDTTMRDRLLDFITYVDEHIKREDQRIAESIPDTIWR